MRELKEICSGLDSGPVPREGDTSPAAPRARSGGNRVLRAAVDITVVLCVAITLIHVLLVFLHVAPANVVSQRYSRTVNAWVYPLFEQNWRLFAPDPDSVNRQISARTAHTTPDGSVKVGPWFDLTAVDTSAVEHHPFPSHTAQNLLRRSWTSYVETLGGDDEPRSDRAVMMRTYLRNIAAERVAAHRGGPFEAIQLRVITRPVAAPDAADGDRPSPPASPATAETRLLPWWKVTPHGN